MSRLVRKYTNYGTIEAEYYVNDENGKEIIEGVYKLLLDNGSVRGIINYVNGKKNGQCIKYFVSNGKLTGNLSSICYYVDDKLEGEFIDYDQYNNIHKICYYLNNELHGEYKEYHSSSHNQLLYIHCYYKNGELDGKYIKYHNPNDNNNGHIKEIKDSYNEGKLTGSIKYYNTDGKLLLIQYYYNNGLICQFEINDNRYKFGIDNSIEESSLEFFNKFKEHIIANPLPKQEISIDDDYHSDHSDDHSDDDSNHSDDHSDDRSDDHHSDDSDTDSDINSVESCDYKKKLLLLL
jgi:antitoxin component YwqK of YwqJK toxin-antitoxin module